MPQLDPSTFVAQLFWLVLSFVILYLLMWRVALPKVADVLQERQERIDDALRHVVREVQASADAKSLELILRIPSKLPRVVGDPQKLHQVWTNLVGNAIKYTPAGGTVGVDVQADDKMLRVRISDTGIGIAAEFHEKIFEKFFRVNEEAVASEVGSGLGLCISREIVRMHGGTIEVESVPGEGATLVVALPLESNDAGANASRSASNRSERGTHG